MLGFEEPEKYALTGWTLICILIAFTSNNSKFAMIETWKQSTDYNKCFSVFAVFKSESSWILKIVLHLKLFYLIYKFKKIKKRSWDQDLCKNRMSRKRDLNPRHPPWQGGALPAELFLQKWAMQGLNLRPSACRADALPAELIAHCCVNYVWFLNYNFFLSRLLI